MHIAEKTVSITGANRAIGRQHQCMKATTKFTVHLLYLE
jgi:hypothetical protein